MKYYTNLLCFSILSFLPLSFSVSAKTIVDEQGEADQKNLIRYIDSKEQRILDPSTSTQDAKNLANSVEFEVYIINEDFSSRSVFVSGEGVCNGFEGDNGVDFTNSTNNYLSPSDDSQYYGGIIGASLYRQDEPKNVQYMPVYVINNPQLEKEIREREESQTKQTIKDKVDSNKQLLDKMVCKKGKR
ncbi:hypothetical protein PHA51_04545 [Rodentibacter pneumotropicus]|uniref:hypothetical protein n=1 Tax=Rodentibacter pneumotropicus TaxID=758 RepID=UPI00232C1500|nr:hypothetical protein [Rodentibacter pneumotropicus]MDC2825306.1 hypothetical protein [Rodentibacter pneumotropicus]